VQCQIEHRKNGLVDFLRINIHWLTELIASSPVLPRDAFCQRLMIQEGQSFGLWRAESGRLLAKFVEQSLGHYPQPELGTLLVVRGAISAGSR
jgi:hypothetical protein